MVKLCYAYVIFASYGLQFYVPMDFLEPTFFNFIKSTEYRFPNYYERLKPLIQIMFRTVIGLIIGESISMDIISFIWPTCRRRESGIFKVTKLGTQHFSKQIAMLIQVIASKQLVAKLFPFSVWGWKG